MAAESCQCIIRSVILVADLTSHAFCTCPQGMARQAQLHEQRHHTCIQKVGAAELPSIRWVKTPYVSSDLPSPHRLIERLRTFLDQLLDLLWRVQSKLLASLPPVERALGQCIQ